jgi:glycine/D-amino acid oxidase-like deaminating enzyme
VKRHYDVAVLGGGIGALACAALLARRSWRVLVLGQGWRPPSYAFDGVALARRAFTLLFASSPAWTRVLVELAQSQTFRRRVLPLDPMLQVLGPSLRLAVPPDASQFGREVDREFSEVRRVVDELYAELARTNAAADAAFERDAVWPPGTFWERRETARVLATLPHVRDAADLLAEFPRSHDFRTVVDVPARFASDLGEAIPPFALARLHGAWTRGVARLEGGEAELVDFLVERIRAQGGEARLGDRASSLIVRGGRVAGVVIDGDDEPMGVQFVVTDLPTRSLLDLAPEFTPSRRVLAQMPEVSVADERFVVSMVVRDAGLPAPLGDEAFLLPSRPLEAARPVVHLQRWRGASVPEGTSLLVAEVLLDGTERPTHAREQVLRVVEQALPFVEQHYLLVDSPHDGRPLWDYRSGKRVEVDRARARAGGASLDAEPMIARWGVTPTNLHGLAGEPLRTPLGNAFSVGRTTLPALGQEGEIVAAWGAARVITRTDRGKEKMRRDLWSKIELG